jgi:hypothetical protein
VFILVCLLIGDADQLCELLLGETEHDPPLADAGPDMPIDILRTPRPGSRFELDSLLIAVPRGSAVRRVWDTH